MISTFPKIWHVGSLEVRDNLFTGGVEVTEKIDGSQIGFGLMSDGKLCIRSKGTIIYHDTYLRAPDSLFKGAVEYIISIKDKLHEQTSYYGEVVSTNKHNTLKYNAVPRNYIVLYGIQSKGFWCDDHDILTREVDKLGFDSVPLLYHGVISDLKQLDEFLNTESYYGGTKIEGMVIKNYNQVAVSAYSTMCFGKYVSEAFKEANHAGWAAKPSKIENFYASFTNKARWEKTLQHLRDDGKLTDTPKDIGLIIETTLSDFETEEAANLKEQLYTLYVRQVKQFVVKGLPEYYKAHLVSKSVVGGIVDEVNTSINAPSLTV